MLRGKPIDWHHHQFRAEVIRHNRRIGDEEVLQLSTAHQSLGDTGNLVGQISKLHVFLVDAVAFHDRLEVGIWR